MASISYTKRRTHIKERKNFYPIRGKFPCTEINTTQSSVDETYSEVSPDRPNRRPKPDAPILSPTARGPFSKELYQPTFVRALQASSQLCSGKMTPFESERQWTRDPRRDFNQVALVIPPWETPMRNKIKSYRVSLAEALGEWRDTADAVVGTARWLKRAHRFIKRLRRWPLRRWPRVLRHLWKQRKTLTFGDIPATYLFAIFGVNPQLALIGDCVEALQLAATRPIVKRFVVTRRAESVQERLSPKGGSATYRRTASRRAILYVRYKPNLGEFTAGNVMESVWAGLPCSFMIDYFINIGEWLSAIDALEGVQNVVGTVVEKRREHCIDRRGWVPNELELASHAYTAVREGRYVWTYYHRTVATINDVTWPTSLEVKDPKTGMDAFSRLLSAVAILYQLRAS